MQLTAVFGRRNLNKCGLILSSALWLIVLQLSVHAGQNVSLSWNPSPDAGVSGYRIYYGVDSHKYGEMIDVGNVTNAVITVPDGPGTYYFAATSYDYAGNESD